MRRLVPTLGLTAAGLAMILNFETRSTPSIALSGSATIAGVDSSGTTSTGSSSSSSNGPATTAPSTAADTQPSSATAERQQIMSQLPDWVIERINEQFPDGIPLDLLEQVAYELGIPVGSSGSKSGSTASASSGPTTTGPTTTGPTTTLSPTAQVVDGPTANTPFGPYQVEVTIDGGQITDVAFVRTPRDMQSMAIVRYALPRLTDQTLSNQSGEVQFISGATYTSYAYQQSLQAALDAAGF